MNKLFVVSIALSLAMSVFAGMEFAGDNTPANDMKKYFSPENVKTVMEGIAAAGAEVPNELAEVSNMVQEFSKQQEIKEQSEKINVIPAPKEKTPEEKLKINLRNSYKTIELAKLNPKKTEEKETQALSELSETVGAVEPKPAEKTAEAIIQCTTGDCCDLSTGMFKVKGTTCYSGPCEEATECMGFSNVCPPSDVHKDDGSPCQGGSCKAGVCVMFGDQPKKEEKKEKKVEEEYVFPILPESAFPQGSFASQQKGKCSSGGCCDMTTGKFMSRGTPCQSDHPCKMASGMCNGYTSTCPLKAKPDGSACPNNGQCMYGECSTMLPQPKKSVPQPQIISVIAPRQRVQKTVKVPQIDRKAEILRLSKEKNKLTDMLMVKGILGFMKHHIEEEKEMNKRAYFPFQVSPKVTEESAENTFSVHDYIRKTTEKKRSDAVKAKAAEVKAKADAANLQASKSSSSTTVPTYVYVSVIAGGAFVIIIVAAVVVSSSANKNKKNQKLHEEYDKI